MKYFTLLTDVNPEDVQVVDLRLQLNDGTLPGVIEQDIRDIVAQQLNDIHVIQDELLNRSICVY